MHLEMYSHKKLVNFVGTTKIQSEARASCSFLILPYWSNIRSSSIRNPPANLAANDKKTVPIIWKP